MSLKVWSWVVLGLHNVRTKFRQKPFSGYEVVTCGHVNPANVTGAVFQPFVTNAPEPVVDTDFITCAVCA